MLLPGDLSAGAGDKRRAGGRGEDRGAVLLDDELVVGDPDCDRADLPCASGAFGDLETTGVHDIQVVLGERRHENEHSGCDDGQDQHEREHGAAQPDQAPRSEEHTSELQSLMRSSYAVFCLKTKNTKPEYTNK